MKLLLDTHIWVQTLLRPERLSRGVRRELDDPKNELFLSPISIWEAGHLASRKKIRIHPTFQAWVVQALELKPMQEAPLNFAVAAEASGIHLPQPDLGDLFLAATASVFGLTLVTADRQLIKCSWLKTLPDV
jgi:PIN domain nuclease of toxin-antitoxin system